MTLKPSVVAVIASVALGIVLVGVALVIVLLRDPLSPQVFFVTRVILALGAGGVSGGFLGTLEIEGSIGNLVVKAGGPFAMTVLVYIVNPLGPVQGFIG